MISLYWKLIKLDEVKKIVYYLKSNNIILIVIFFYFNPYIRIIVINIWFPKNQYTVNLYLTGFKMPKTIGWNIVKYKNIKTISKKVKFNCSI